MNLSERFFEALTDDRWEPHLFLAAQLGLLAVAAVVLYLAA